MLFPDTCTQVFPRPPDEIYQWLGTSYQGPRTRDLVPGTSYLGPPGPSARFLCVTIRVDQFLKSFLGNLTPELAVHSRSAQLSLPPVRRLIPAVSLMNSGCHSNLGRNFQFFVSKAGVQISLLHWLIRRSQICQSRRRLTPLIMHVIIASPVFARGAYSGTG